MSLSSAIGIDTAISALDGWLLSQDYTGRAREGIAAHIRREGELSGAVGEYLDREHAEVAEAILVESFAPVPPDSDEWADDGRWTPNDVFRVSPPELDDSDAPDAPDWNATRQPGYREALERDGITLLPAVSGGAPEPEPTPFEPTPEDWDDYRRDAERRDQADGPRYGYE